MSMSDSSPACCDSPDEPHTRVCLHLFNKWLELKAKVTLPYHFRFAAGSRKYELICEDCANSGRAATRSLCHDCCDTVIMNTTHRRADIRPKVIDKSVGLMTEVRPLTLKADLQAVSSAHAGGAWFAVTSDLRVISFHSEDSQFRPVANLQDVLPSGTARGILSDRTGSMVVVFEESGSKAVVLDTERGSVLMSLDRGDYHTEHCKYPVAFFERGGRTLLVHATDWNRVDVSDPRSAELLTSRHPHQYQDGQQPPHYLDYFHCSLAVSPNGKWITSNGWVWHPWGSVRCWDLSRWLNENVWESEDGPTVTSLCGADYYWDRPLCWVDDNKVAWWGIGDDDLTMLPAIVVHNMEKVAERVIIPGPFGGLPLESPSSETQAENQNVDRTEGGICFDRWLFAWKPQHGLSAWDISDGSRVYNRQDICPVAYNPSRREFLCRKGNDWSVLRFIAGFDP